MEMKIITLDGQAAGSIQLNPAVFGVPVRQDLLHRYMMWQRQSGRVVTANTKTRDTVHGTTKKFVKQKGSGGARHGDKKAPQFRHGGVSFGPLTHVVSHDLPKAIRRLALATALSAKAASNSLVVIKDAKSKTFKTKDLAAQLAKLELTNVLFVVDSLDTNFDMASRNLPHVKVVPTLGANVYDILRADKLVLTADAVKLLEARLQQKD